MRLFLIGMPGSGKSTIAKYLAKALSYKYVDLDALIEKEALMFIEEIFDKYGQKAFRKLESDALLHLPNDEDMVVACGGGIVIDKKNKEHMQGITFYLDTDIEVIKERLEHDYQRPLLLKKTLEQLFDERYLKYQDFADVVINGNYDIKETVDVMLNYIKSEAIK